MIHPAGGRIPTAVVVDLAEVGRDRIGPGEVAGIGNDAGDDHPAIAVGFSEDVEIFFKHRLATVGHAVLAQVPGEHFVVVTLRYRASSAPLWLSQEATE